MELRVVVPGFVPALLSGIIIAIIGKLTSVHFSTFQIGIIVAVVIVAHVIVDLVFRAIRRETRPPVHPT